MLIFLIDGLGEKFWGPANDFDGGSLNRVRYCLIPNKSSVHDLAVVFHEGLNEGLHITEKCSVGIHVEDVFTGLEG